MGSSVKNDTHMLALYSFFDFSLLLLQDRREKVRHGPTITEPKKSQKSMSLDRETAVHRKTLLCKLAFLQVNFPLLCIFPH